MHVLILGPIKMDWIDKTMSGSKRNRMKSKCIPFLTRTTMTIKQEVILSAIRSIIRLNQIAICWVKITVRIGNYYYQHMPPLLLHSCLLSCSLSLSLSSSHAVTLFLAFIFTHDAYLHFKHIASTDWSQVARSHIE